MVKFTYYYRGVWGIKSVKGTGLGCLGALFCFALIFALPFTFDDGGIFNLILIIGAISCLIAGMRYDSKRKISFGDQQKEKLKNVFNTLDDFSATQEFTSPNFESGIAIDEMRKKICIIENQHKNYGEVSETNKYEYQIYVYSFSEIIQSEILKNGVTITKISRSDQISGAIVGGALGGGAGAIIGGLGASSQSITTITSLELQIVVNNAKNSVHKVTFLSPNSIGAFITGDELKAINHWHNLFTHILNRNDDNRPTVSSSPSLSVADELTKLAQVRRDGLLTEEEFEQQKQKILSN
jgi:hypothetical protein